MKLVAACLCSIGVFSFSSAVAQELNCRVTLNPDNSIAISDRSIFKDMERAITQFMNTRKWTTDNYKQHEKINCSIFLNLKMPSIGVFEASAQIMSTRPVYGTMYETIVFNFGDRDFNFEYLESQPMDYNDNVFQYNLTSMLAFYAYLIIAMDYDSFSELGGTAYYQKAFQVMMNAQSTNRAGWTIGSVRSRYTLMNDGFNNPQMQDWRKGTYIYHRLGMDVLAQKADEARAKILSVLQTQKRIWTVNPAAILLSVFFDTKSTELANVFSSGELPKRREAYDILSALDTRRTVYQKIISD